ncbi:hypothetical protein HOLleu_33804 [Holothuria leucospilota]|uniref:Uncharacterized protein n=1 Tax=Holothuria leucospilota TaxID=206669 RepID=A0A9Q0YRA8_HOLLE|nr:hypothetical protein HOLleu_33804 [Holothuria leucospilota]
MAFPSGSIYVGQQWPSRVPSVSNMDLFTCNQRVTANQLNGKRRQHFESNTADVDAADLMQSTAGEPANKKQCNGIYSFYKAESHVLDQGGNWEKDANDNTVSVAMETESHLLTVQVPQNKPRNICSRCLAGEPGHIKHIVAFH